MGESNVFPVTSTPSSRRMVPGESEHGRGNAGVLGGCTGGVVGGG